MLKQLLITIRGLARRPAFSIAAVLTLATGIAATTAIFSTVSATLLRPLPYPASHEIYALTTHLSDNRFSSGRMAGAQLEAIQESATTVSHAVVYSTGTLTFTRDGLPPRGLALTSVTEGFFELFGLPVAAGRTFVPEDHQRPPMQPGEAPAFTVSAIISDRLWTELFGRDPAIIGRPMAIQGADLTIVGVAAPEFDVPTGTEIWIANPMPTGIGHSFLGYVRVQPGTTRDALMSELNGIMPRVIERYPVSTGRIFVTQPLVESIVGDLGPILLVVLGGAVLLLILGCINVSTLILGRGVEQTREMAICAALGAPRGRILSRFLTEGAVLATAGTLLGLFLAFVAIRLMVTFGSAGLPRLDSIPFDGRVLAFAALTMLVATLVIGVLPALRLSSPDIRSLLGEGGRSASGTRASRRLLGGLVVAEIALAIMLVAGAGWLVRGYMSLAERNLGFTPAGRLLIEARMPDDQGAVQHFVAEAPGRLAAIGQITSVGSTTALPLRPFRDVGLYVGVPGESYDPDRQDVALSSGASVDYFEAIGVRVLAGRALTEADRPPPPLIETDPATGISRVVPRPNPEPPRVVINQAFADRFFAGKDPIGQRFAMGFPLVNFNSLYEVVGVVENVRYSNLNDPERPISYSFMTVSPTRLVVSTTLDDPTELIPTIRAALGEVNASIPLDVTPYTEMVRVALAPYRLGLTLMSLFALISLGLAAIGIFGVVAHTTSERSREFATRAALGATPRDVVGMLMKQARGQAAAGAILGALAAIVGGRIVASRVYEVPARDPAIVAAAAGAVLAITLVAYLLPALRASRITPADSLKAE